MSQPLKRPAQFGAFSLLLLLVLLLLIVFITFSKNSISTGSFRLQLGRQSPVVSGSTAAAARRLAPHHNGLPESLRRSPSLIRVNVTPGGTQSLLLSISGGYSIRHADTAEERTRNAEMATVKVESTSNGLAIGHRVYEVARLEIIPQASPAIRVNGHLYRGIVRLFRRNDGKVSAVNVLPVEEYLASVIDAEMPAHFPDAARKAQAVVARTYALYQKKQAHPSAVYDLFASQRSQKYLGVEYLGVGGKRLAGESASSREIVDATRGVVCQFQGQVFCTYYSACCGGRTTIGSELFSDAAAVLKTVPCEWCRDSKHYRWIVDMPRTNFLDGLKGLSALTTVQQTAGPGGGVISRFLISDGQRTLDISGVELRDQLSAGTLPSPHFSLKLNSEGVHFEGRGHGHGVGFCQWGANGQAREGKSYTEIIRHYYPGAEIVAAE